MRPLSLLATVWFTCGALSSQIVIKPLLASSRTEPGLEHAVEWKWWVAPPEKPGWGMPLPDELKPKEPGAPGAMVRPETYEVKKGDAIVKIARKFDMTAAQLMRFNELTGDRIIIGQTLRIPTPGQVLAMAPPPPPPPPEPKKDAARKKMAGRQPVLQEPDFDIDYEARTELETVLLQVFLDREMFSPGMIDGQSGPTLEKISQIYQQTHADAADPARLKAKAMAELKEPYTHYLLRVDDFRFIKPTPDKPAPARAGRPPTAGRRSSKPATTTPPPLRDPLEELLAEDFLAYTSTWEFVAERFHCDEEFLRRINHNLKGTPVVGTEFQVPNVIPFEIEKALDSPLQPAADPQKPVTVAVVALSRLEISRDGRFIAVMPLASARPGLHGRGSWTVLDAIPQPRMATRREPREPPKTVPAPAGGDSPAATPATEPPPATVQYLAPGPNNPVGLIWLNLARSGGTDPLPYGLHGTRNPALMGTRQGIGGFRLTNWDIARAIHLIPVGTELQWKAR